MSKYYASKPSIFDNYCEGAPKEDRDLIGQFLSLSSNVSNTGAVFDIIHALRSGKIEDAKNKTMNFGLWELLGCIIVKIIKTGRSASIAGILSTFCEAQDLQ
jgi:hypothetical protein